ncbi:C-type lectin lectoxin-Lio3-like [Haliotis cracherodii]|uniref:C-type lectin lectoxin-Lio3-like n=1 Tax=Haliotis cracherodii TaxID=6455 RepID=UPI0039EBE204
MAAVLGMSMLLKGTFLTSPLTDVWVTSKLDCISKCYMQVNCSSVFYNSNTHLCQHGPDVYGDSQLTAAADGTQYFIWTTVACGNGYTWHRRLNLCYKLYETKGTWFVAKSTCATDTGHLNRVDNADTNMFMNAVAKNLGGSVWSDASDRQTEGAWVWSNGSVVNRFFWDDGQPAAGDTIQSCLIIRHYGGPNRWHDDNCSQLRAFVCQLPMSEISNC